MEDRSRLIQNVKEWIGLDNEIKTLQREIKERRKKKKNITFSLVDIMKNNEIDCFDITDGQLIYTKKNVKNPLSKKHLLKSLSEFFKNDKLIVGQLGKYIMETRESKTREDIRRKINIK